MSGVIANTVNEAVASFAAQAESMMCIAPKKVKDLKAFIKDMMKASVQSCDMMTEEKARQQIRKAARNINRSSGEPKRKVLVTMAEHGIKTKSAQIETWNDFVMYANVNINIAPLALSMVATNPEIFEDPPAAEGEEKPSAEDLGSL